MAPYVVVAHSKAKPGKGDELYEELARTVREAYEAEPELRTYSVSRVDGTNDEFLHIEVYDSAAGFQNHQDSSHVAAFIDRVSDLLAGDIDIRAGFEAPVADTPKATLVR